MCFELAELHDGSLLFSFDEGKGDSKSTKTKNDGGTSAAQSTQSDAPQSSDQLSVNQPENSFQQPQSDAAGAPVQRREPAEAEAAAAEVAAAAAHTASSAHVASSPQSSDISKQPQQNPPDESVSSSASSVDVEEVKVTLCAAARSVLCCAVPRLQPQ